MNMTRKEAAKEVGAAAVEAVESEQLLPTNRVIDGYAEFRASTSCVDADGDKVELEMLVCVPQQEYDAVEELDLIDWDKYAAQAEYRLV